MKQLVLFFTFFALCSSKVISQDTIYSNYGTFRKAISIGINCPLGKFGETHGFGLSAWYSWRPAMRVVKKIKASSPKRVEVLLEGGLDYFFGRRDRYDYKYKGYFIFQGLAGISYTSHKKNFCTLTAGLAPDLYAGRTELGLGSHLSGNFYTRERIIVTPGIRLLKYKEANVLWVATVGISYWY
jgi:hypothetical protein